MKCPGCQTAFTADETLCPRCVGKAADRLDELKAEVRELTEGQTEILDKLTQAAADFEQQYDRAEKAEQEVARLREWAAKRPCQKPRRIPFGAKALAAFPDCDCIPCQARRILKEE